jgi:hypothetical protein
MPIEGPRIELSTARHLFVEYREEIREVFRRAVQQAVLEHKRAGNPIAVSENGEVIWIEPEQIKTDATR